MQQNLARAEKMLENHVTKKHGASSNRGTKQTCQNETCASRFYDLNRLPPTCSYCGANSDAVAIVVINFETLGKPVARKFNRRPDLPKKTAELETVDAIEKKTESDDEIPSTAEELLIESDDDDESEEMPVENAGDDV
jgi:hypothetical protein